MLDGTELAGYIQERQLKQVRNLRQGYGVVPKLAIVQTVDNPVIDTYVRMKRRYGDEIHVEVEVVRPNVGEIIDIIKELNIDSAIHGIIVQLPLADGVDVKSVLNSVEISKDVDGLAESSEFVPATAQAIDWLLTGYNINTKNSRIAIVGNGTLVGQPLSKLWSSYGFNVTTLDEHSKNIAKSIRRSDIVVTATGVPGLITPDMLKAGAVVVDAATSSEQGKIVGDVADEVRQRTDLTLTPEKGGVGPLTVTSLFENVIRAARVVASAKDSASL